MKTKIKIELSLDELNLILEALGNMAFIRVFALIQNLQTQYENNKKED